MVKCFQKEWKREEGYLREYRQAFADALIALVSEHRNVMLVESDIASPAREWLKKEAPDQFVDTGVAEANAVTIAAGLASEGYVSYWYTYGFLIERAYNQIKQSVVEDKRNVKIFAYNCGVSGVAGASHNEILDLAFMRVLPNFTVMAPADDIELEKMVYASFLHDGAVYVRFPRGRAETIFNNDYNFKIGKGVKMKDGKDVTVIACGSMVKDAMVASCDLMDELDVEIINMSTIKPLDRELIIDSAKKTGAVVTVEEHSIIGGLGEAVSAVLSQNCPVRMRIMGITDVITQSGKGDLRPKYGLTSQNISKNIREVAEKC